jgi:hypothetical protein
MGTIALQSAPAVAITTLNAVRGVLNSLRFIPAAGELAHGHHVVLHASAPGNFSQVDWPMPAAPAALPAEIDFTFEATTVGPCQITMVDIDTGTILATLDLTVAAPAPTIVSVLPNSGPDTGGTVVTITGTEFSAGTKIYFNGVEGTDLVFVSPTEMKIKAPPHLAGAVTVRVKNPDGQEKELPNSFTYLAAGGAPPPPPGGGVGPVPPVLPPGVPTPPAGSPCVYVIQQVGAPYAPPAPAPVVVPPPAPAPGGAGGGAAPAPRPMWQWIVGAVVAVILFALAAEGVAMLLQHGATASIPPAPSASAATAPASTPAATATTPPISQVVNVFLPAGLQVDGTSVSTGACADPTKKDCGGPAKVKSP